MQVAEKVEAQEALPSAGVLGAEPLSLMPQHFPCEALLPGDGGQSGFFDSLLRAKGPQGWRLQAWRRTVCFRRPCARRAGDACMPIYSLPFFSLSESVSLCCSGSGSNPAFCGAGENSPPLRRGSGCARCFKARQCGSSHNRCGIANPFTSNGAKSTFAGA